MDVKLIEILDKDRRQYRLSRRAALLEGSQGLAPPMQSQPQLPEIGEIIRCGCLVFAS